MDNDILACSVCFERIVDPQVLPGCGHTFCNACLQRIIGQGRLACPTCRATFRPSDVKPNFTLQAFLAEGVGAGPDAGGGGSALGSGQPPARAVMVRDAGNSERGRRKQLEFLGVPPRLAQTVAEEDSKVGRRIFLLDNSGSTASPDGKAFDEVQDSNSTNFRVRPCTRWDEIKQVALEQAKWNSLQGTPCEFVLLNGSGGSREGVDVVTVEGDQNAAKLQMQALEGMLARTSPGGRTPLGTRVREIGERISVHKESLCERGQKVYLVILTDGLPDNGQEFTMHLNRVMTTLPVVVVIRLCTDESNVVQYYNSVEEDLEKPLDVLDDPAGEAQELASKGNGWFAYTLPLHRIREGGTFVKLFDLLDERKLTTLEMVLLVHQLLQEPGDQHLSSDPVTFCDEVERLASSASPVYDVRRRAMAPPVDAASLRVAVLGRPLPQWYQCILRVFCFRGRARQPPVRGPPLLDS